MKEEIYDILPGQACTYKIIKRTGFLAASYRVFRDHEYLSEYNNLAAARRFIQEISRANSQKAISDGCQQILIPGRF